MPRTSDKRERLVEAAKDLIHRQGLKQTTLADIASASEVPLGNVYYYFKTKDDLAAAVIEERMDALCQLLGRCDCQRDPRARLTGLLDHVSGMAELIADRGCPIGTLCEELDKSGSALEDKARRLLRRELDWAAEQFQALGRDDAEALARHLVSAVQGASVTAHVLHDPRLLREEMGALARWVESL